VPAFIFDASAVVKRYLKETGSGWIHGLADPAASHELFLTRIARVEVVAAVTRRGRGNVIPAAVQVWGDRGFVRMWWDRSQSAFPGQGTW
jgi:predicted nucleic acid-binding protein